MYSLLQLGALPKEIFESEPSNADSFYETKVGVVHLHIFCLVWDFESNPLHRPVRSSRCRKPYWASCWGTSPRWRPAPGRCWRETGTWCPCLWFLTLNRGDELIEALTWRTVICEAFQKCPKGSSGTQQASPIGWTMYIGQFGSKAIFQMIEL